MKQQAIVIGAGVAGLAASIRLACKGYAVQVFEANEGPGGKLRELKLGGYRFDAGPSLFTLPEQVDELFILAGKDPRAYFNYHRKENVCRYHFADGTVFHAPASRERYAEEAAKTFGVSADAVRAYWRNSRRKFELTKGVFLERSLHRLATYTRFGTFVSMLQLGRLDLFRSLHDVNHCALEEPRLVQLFDRYATYNGSDPYRTPGVMSLIPHLEQGRGTYFPKGGMYGITRALYKLGVDCGVVFNFGSRVDEIMMDGKKVSGVRLGVRIIPASTVVCNMDIVPAYKHLLPGLKPPSGLDQQERSTSGIIFYWGVRKQFPQLDLHNIFFSADYRKEFDQMFRLHEMPDEPTVYLNISAREEKGDAPEDCENWFVMVNAPADRGQAWDALIAQTRVRVLQVFQRHLGANIESFIEKEDVLDPRSIASGTSSFRGALYGTASNTMFSAFLRHPNFRRGLRGLYFCGGSVHPGGGIPLCLLSARIATDDLPAWS